MSDKHQDSFIAAMSGPGYWQEPTDQAKADELRAKADALEEQAEALHEEAEELYAEARQYGRHWVSTGPGLLDDTSTPFLSRITAGDHAKTTKHEWGMAEREEEPR